MSIEINERPDASRSIEARAHSIDDAQVWLGLCLGWVVLGLVWGWGLEREDGASTGLGDHNRLQQLSGNNGILLSTAQPTRSRPPRVVLP